MEEIKMDRIEDAIADFKEGKFESLSFLCPLYILRLCVCLCVCVSLCLCVCVSLCVCVF